MRPGFDYKMTWAKNDFSLFSLSGDPLTYLLIVAILQKAVTPSVAERM